MTVSMRVMGAGDGYRYLLKCRRRRRGAEPVHAGDRYYAGTDKPPSF